MVTKDLEMSVIIPSALPNEIFEILMDSEKHSKLSGSKAKIGRKVSDSFSVWDGAILGKNLEIVDSKKIVQEWFCETEGWPEGHYSNLTFEFTEKDGGTEIKLTQTGIPELAYEDIKEGWEDYYFKPLKSWFA